VALKAATVAVTNEAVATKEVVVPVAKAATTVVAKVTWPETATRADP